MFCRRYSPFVHDIFDMDVMPIPSRQAFMPEELFAVLGPWAEQQRCGGKMCKRKPRIKHGKVAIPKSQEHRPARNFKITEEPWETVVHADGFEPRDYTIFAQGRTLFINGVRSEGDEDTGIVKTEFRRKVNIPNDVILPSLCMDFKESKIVISARRQVIRMDPEVKGKEKQQQQQEKIEQNAERNDMKEKEMEIPICKEAEEINVAAPASEAGEVSADKNTSSGMENGECPCKESSDCANLDCRKKSAESEDDVSIEDIGPEEDMDEVRSEATEGCQDSLIIDEPKEIAEHVKDATQDEGKAAQLDDAKKTQKMDREVCEYKPFTWSIRLLDFDAKDVKVHLEDNSVRVTAEHEEENNGMTSFRRMERTFALPRNAEQDTLRSRFCSDDGTLTIEVMPKNETQLTDKSERLPDLKEPEQTIKLGKDELGWTVLPISFE